MRTARFSDSGCGGIPVGRSPSQKADAPVGRHPLLCEQNENTSENITLSQTSFAGGKNLVQLK